MTKPLREIVPIKEGVLRALGMGAAAAGAGALVGASSIGGAPIGAPAGAAIALGGYALFGGLKKDLNHKASDDAPEKTTTPKVASTPNTIKPQQQRKQNFAKALAMAEGKK